MTSIASSGATLEPVDSLVEHPRNPRRGDVDAIVESIKANGFISPIVFQLSTRMVLAGNHRLQAARRLGMSEIPAVSVDCDDARALRILLADNRASDLGEYDENILAEIFRSMPQIDADAALFDADAVSEILTGVQEILMDDDEDDVAGPDGAVDSVLGSLYELGPHRLVCGDCRDKAIVEMATGGGLVNIIWTDPPYGVSYDGGPRPTSVRPTTEIENDDLDSAGLRSLLLDAFTLAVDVCEDGATWYVAAPAGPQTQVFGEVLGSLGVWRQTIVWVKDRLVLGRSDYHYRHESIFYGWKPPSHRRVEDRTRTTVWEIARPSRSDEHPTMKPVELVRQAILDGSRVGDRVLDPFSGSGSTLIAAASTGRMASCIEIDPRYCDVIRRRWTRWAREHAVEPGQGVLE